MSTPSAAEQAMPAQNNTTSLPTSPSTDSLASKNSSTSQGGNTTGATTPLEFATTTTATVTFDDDDAPTWPKEVRAWLCLFGCFLLMFNSWGLVNAYGTYASYYKEHLLPGEDLLKWNLVGSSESFIVLALSGVVGRLLDAGYCRYLIAVGAVLVTLGEFMLSLANGDGGPNQGNYGLIWLTQGFIVGLGMACFFVSSSQIAATWFIKRKAMAIGIVASGASIAGLVYPLMTRFLILQLGFNNAVRCVAGLVGLTALTSFLFCTPNPKHVFRKPKSWKKLNVWIDPHAFESASFNWFTASVCFVFLGFYAVFFNLEEWAVHHGFGRKDVPGGPGIPQDGPMGNSIQTFWLLSIMNASSTLGRLLSAWSAQSRGALNVHMFSTLTAAVLLLAFWPFVTTLEAALGFVVVFGAVSGSVIGLPPASIANILGAGPVAQSKLGQWTGMMYTAAAIPALVGPLIAGHLISAYDSNYLTVQLWSGFCLLAGGFCMAIAALYMHYGQDARLGREPLRKARASIWSMSSSISKVLTWEKDDGAQYQAEMARKEGASAV